MFFQLSMPIIVLLLNESSNKTSTNGIKFINKTLRLLYFLQSMRNENSFGKQAFLEWIPAELYRAVNQYQRIAYLRYE